MRNAFQLLSDKVEEQCRLNNHLGNKIHRLREARKNEREINVQTRIIDKRLQAALTAANGELVPDLTDALLDLHNLLIGPELAARAAREVRLEAKRAAEASQTVANAATTA